MGRDEEPRTSLSFDGQVCLDSLGHHRQPPRAEVGRGVGSGPCGARCHRAAFSGQRKLDPGRADATRGASPYGEFFREAAPHRQRVALYEALRQPGRGRSREPGQGHRRLPRAPQEAWQAGGGADGASRRRRRRGRETKNACQGQRQRQTGGDGQLGPSSPRPPLTGLQSFSAGRRAVRVPGAGATTVDASVIWSFLPRWLLGEAAPFASFFRGLVSIAPARGAPATASAFPMPLPYPKLYKRRARGRASRTRRAEQQAVNLVVAMLSWLSLGSPAHCPGWLAAGTPLTGEQRGVARRLEAVVRVIARHPPVKFEDMGRAAARVETLEGSLHCLSDIAAKFGLLRDSYGRQAADLDGARSGSPLPGTSSSEQLPGETASLGRGRPDLMPEVAEAYAAGPDAEFLQGLFLSGETEFVAKDLEAHRLKLTGRPSFNPLPHLDLEAAAHYENPFAFMKDPSEVSEKLPRPRFRASREEKLKVLDLLDKTGRLTFHPARDVLPAYTNGLFGLVKSQEKDRLILDARCPNLRESLTGAWIRSMATFTSLLSIQLLPGERMVFGGEDLKDFY